MIYRYSLLFLLGGILIAQDLTPKKSYLMLPPIQSLNHLSQKLGWRLPEREKREKGQGSNLLATKKYIIGKFISKSLARFHKPKIVKGTSFLSWVYRNGKTDNGLLSQR